MSKNLDISTPRGYMNRFWELASEHQDSRAPMREALRSLESELSANHGARRYSTYESFSAAKSRGLGGIRLTFSKTV